MDMTNATSFVTALATVLAAAGGWLAKMWSDARQAKRDDARTTVELASITSADIRQWFDRLEKEVHEKSEELAVLRKLNADCIVRDAVKDEQLKQKDFHHTAAIEALKQTHAEREQTLQQQIVELQWALAGRDRRARS